jgi:hypothetical protein
LSFIYIYMLSFQSSLNGMFISAKVA